LEIQSDPIFRAAVFAYKQVDPTASSVFVANLQDGQEIRISADFFKVK
jgi:CRISPR/Cas system CSM-associated protein Csm4 (group 5 of RAMP superfamily)